MTDYEQEVLSLLRRIAVAVEARVPAARPKREKAPVFPSDSSPLRLAYRLCAIINDDATASAANLQAWAREFDLILHIDKRSAVDVARMIDFATSDTFWQKVILSPKKLRKHWIAITKSIKPTARPATPGQEKKL